MPADHDEAALVDWMRERAGSAPIPPLPLVAIEQEGSRRRRRKAAGLAILACVAITAGTLAITAPFQGPGRSTGPAPVTSAHPSPPKLPEEYAINTSVERIKPGVLLACYPGKIGNCDLFGIAGSDSALAPFARLAVGQDSGLMHLVGTWHGRELTLTRRPARAARATQYSLPALLHPAACTAAGSATLQDAKAGDSAARQLSGFSGSRINQDTQALTVFMAGSTAYLGRARRRVQAADPGPVCLRRVAYSARDLETAGKEVDEDHDLSRLLISPIWPLPDDGSVDVIYAQVFAATPALRQYVQERWHGMVKLVGLLRPGSPAPSRP